MNKLSKISLDELRKLATNVHAIMNEDESDSSWEEKITPLFAEYDTTFDGINLVTDKSYIPDPNDEDGFPEYYYGFIDEINSMAVNTIEDVEGKILKLAEAIDILNGDIKISTPDNVSGEYNIPTGVRYI